VSKLSAGTAAAAAATNATRADPSIVQPSRRLVLDLLPLDSDSAMVQLGTLAATAV
jgi:hypothetical protein